MSVPLKFPDPHAHDPLPRGAAVYDAQGRHYHDDRDGATDITGREVAILVPLALAVVLLGVMPTPVLDSMLRPVQALRSQEPLAQPTPPLADLHAAADRALP